MHFHQNRPGTPALFRQDISRTLDYLLLETFDVNFDHVDSIAAKRVVQRSHRHCDHTVACVWTRFDSRFQPVRSGKADMPSRASNVAV